MHREIAAVPQPLVAADLDLAPDVRLDLAAQVTLDLEVAFDVFAQLAPLIVGEVLGAQVPDERLALGRGVHLDLLGQVPQPARDLTVGTAGVAVPAVDLVDDDLQPARQSERHRQREALLHVLAAARTATGSSETPMTPLR